jgi:glycosyltransferase involved in cell wall biosynthesis
MRILIAGLGGVTRTFRNWPERVIARDLARRGHEVRAVGMLYPDIPPLTVPRETIDGIEVRRVPQAYWPNFPLARALYEGPRPDVIHIFHPRNVLAAQIMTWAKRHRVPTVYTWNGPYHDPYLVEDRERPFDAPPRFDRLIWTRGELLRRLPTAGGLRGARDMVRNYRLHWPLRAADHLLPCSAFEAEVMRRMDLTQPVTVVPQWLDEEAIHNEPVVEPAMAAPRPWLLFVGQLSPRKGYDLALRALPVVLRRCPTASLLIVSGINAADRDRVERLASELGIDGHVHLLDRLDDTSLVNLFRACDVYVTPTRYEGFGLTLLEAMTLGAPLVATDVPAVNEIVRDGENGLLVPPEDPDVLARAILRLLEDTALRDRLREGGRRTCDERFNPDRLVARLEAVYEEVARPPAVGDEVAYFDNQARRSDRKIGVQYGRMFALARLGRRLPEGPALDVGCGAGPGLRYLAMRGAPSFGVDASFYALKQAGARAACRGLAQTDVRGGLPFRDASFGLVVASEVIEHLGDGGPFLRECRRVLRPGGILLLTTPNLWDVRRLVKPLVGQPWSGDTDPTHINLYTPPRLRRELVIAGFSSPRVRTGLKPMAWVPPHSRPFPIPYPPLIGNGIVATGVR